MPFALQVWPPGYILCITTLPCIALDCIALPWIALLALSVSIELLSASARVTSVKFQKDLVVSEREPDP